MTQFQIISSLNLATEMFQMCLRSAKVMISTESKAFIAVFFKSVYILGASARHGTRDVPCRSMTRCR